MKRACGLILAEPYRMFFPAGMLAGMWGVMMWPMLYAGMLHFYPNEAHTRMMIEGFMGAFVVGFIGTAFPRLTSSRTWSHGEFIVLLALWLLTVISHASGHVSAGDSAFSAMLTVLLLGMASRWLRGNRDIPPPGFVLVFPAFIGAIVAAWALSRQGLSPIQIQSAKLWLYQAFPLLPLMGIGPYLIPRFFGMPSSHSFDDSSSPPAGWWPKAIKAAICGLLIIASFAIEIIGHAIAGHLLRAAVVLVWFAMETPMLRRALTPTTPGNTIRWAYLGIIAGFLGILIWPQARVGSLHLLFASGIALATLAVGARVILGHAGRHDLLGKKIIWLRCVVGLLILAATTRFSADLIPKMQISHFIYAAWAWAIGGAIWLAFLAKHLLRSEDSPKRPSKCPKRQGC